MNATCHRVLGNTAAAHRFKITADGARPETIDYLRWCGAGEPEIEWASKLVCSFASFCARGGEPTPSGFVDHKLLSGPHGETCCSSKQGRGSCGLPGARSH